MKNIFVDTNVWLRFFLADQKEQYQQAVELLEACQTGNLRPYTSSIVFLEVHYVLKGFYKLTYQETLVYLQRIRSTRDITVIDTTDIDVALGYFKIYRVKFSDCLIASQLREDIILVTFDKELKKIKEINTKTPAEVLLRFKKLN